jgi:hypothetical protein
MIARIDPEIMFRRPIEGLREAQMNYEKNLCAAIMITWVGTPRSEVSCQSGSQSLLRLPCVHYPVNITPVRKRAIILKNPP